jgi:rRNA maturation endonuclease Nob1
MEALQKIYNDIMAASVTGDDLTIHEAEEISKYGFGVSYDRDHDHFIYGTTCNGCGKYFWDEGIETYCPDCRRA